MRVTTQTACQDYPREWLRKIYTFESASLFNVSALRLRTDFYAGDMAVPKAAKMKLFAIFAVFALIAVAAYSAFIWKYSEGKLRRLTPNCEALASAAKTKFQSQKITPDILLIGDSRISEWPNSTWATLSSAQILNLGVSGESSRETFCRALGIAPLVDSRKVIIQTGINDLVAASLLMPLIHKATRVDVENAVVDNIVKAHALFNPKNDVYVLSIVPPINKDLFRTIVWGGGIEQSAAAVTTNLSAQELELLDIRTLFKNEGSGWKVDFSRDALHWNALGYEELTKFVLQKMDL